MNNSHNANQKNTHLIYGLLPLLLAFAFQVPAAANEKSAAATGNPFFSAYQTPYNVPPFDRIRPEHYLPALKEGMKRQQQEIAAIVHAAAPATFVNTVAALDRSGQLLNEVGNVFFNLLEANTSEQLQAIAKEAAPLLSRHNDDILLNAGLFRSIQAVYQQREHLSLNAEQRTLLDKYYRDFVRGGANLNPQRQAQLRKINAELALLSLKFGDNVLAETNDFKLVIESQEMLDGLPPDVLAAAAEAAKAQGLAGKWTFTLHKPSLIPLLKYARERELREKMFKAYITRGSRGNALDNRATLARIAALRVQRSQLLGYKTHADFVLEENMAKKPENVYKFLNELWQAVLPVAKHEAQELQKLIDQEGGGFKLEPWDWWYYAEKLKKVKYDLNDEALRPYFKLDNVVNGLFLVANKLYGLQFIENTVIPRPHADARAFVVKEADGRHLGILYMDFFPRPSKSAGAWMNSYRDQCRREGKKVDPVITMVLNFSRPTASKPALFNFEEVTTLFHEFGHALHGLFSDVTYLRTAGTSVARDFVELPSQIMENWAKEPEVLKMFARNYQTGEPIPQDLIDKLEKSGHFNQGFETVEYLAASFLDMDWHTLTEATTQDADRFENESLQRIGLIPEIVVRYRSPYFSHIFSGGYSAGYYSYIWAEVLDADAFQAFKEKGLFDPATALSFRRNILSRGGSEDPMVLYKRFRGAEPKIDALLRRKGLKQ